MRSLHCKIQFIFDFISRPFLFFFRVPPIRMRSTHRKESSSAQFFFRFFFSFVSFSMRTKSVFIAMFHFGINLKRANKRKKRKEKENKVHFCTFSSGTAEKKRNVHQLQIYMPLAATVIQSTQNWWRIHNVQCTHTHADTILFIKHIKKKRRQNVTIITTKKNLCG